jgi:hypothetical protein
MPFAFPPESVFAFAGILSVSYVGVGYHIHESHVVHFDIPQQRGSIAPFFAKRLATDNRIQGANPAPSIALFQQPPTHPIHFLLMDEEIAADISQKFRHALAGHSEGEPPFPVKGIREGKRQLVSLWQAVDVVIDLALRHRAATAPILLPERLSRFRPRRSAANRVLRRSHSRRPSWGAGSVASLANQPSSVSPWAAAFPSSFIA